MLVDRYFEAMEKVLEKSRTTNRETLEKVGEVIAECVARKGQVFIYDSGHLVQQELLYRAGGPLYLKKFEYFFSVKTEPQPRARDTEPGIAVTERDILRDQGKDLVERMGQKARRIEYEGAVHLFITVPGQEVAFQRAVVDAVGFIVNGK